MFGKKLCIFHPLDSATIASLSYSHRVAYAKMKSVFNERYLRQLKSDDEMVLYITVKVNLSPLHFHKEHFILEL